MHYSVLKKETIEALDIKPDGIYVDCTLGYAGHSKEILTKLKRGYLYAFDCDKEAIAYSEKELSKISENFQIFHDNFVNLKSDLESQGILLVDGIIFDLGFSSPQIDEAKRGFSFQNEGPLDMRMGGEGKSAKDIIDTYDVDSLSKIFFRYGEEKLSIKIAKEIIDAKNDIKTTTDLVSYIKKAVGANYFYKNHPERKIFQALRIEVNDELKVLEKVLPDAISILKPKGRLCVITFHSLEDRIVKNIFKEKEEVDILVRGLPNIPDEYKPTIRIINKKPLLPSKKELEENSRSHSAKLRIIERI